MDPLSIARYGMMSAQQQLVRSAERVTRWPDGDVDLAGEVVAQIQAKTQFAACAKVIAFDAEMWRALLDAQKA